MVSISAIIESIEPTSDHMKQAGKAGGGYGGGGHMVVGCLSLCWSVSLVVASSFKNI